MDQQLKLAVCGCGGVAQGAHLPAWQKLPQARLVGLCDVVLEKAEQAAATFGSKAYPDLEALLAAEQPELVDVCTSERHHYEPVMTALTAGCHVLCEKIFTDSLAKGRQMVAAAQRAGVKLGLDYNYRHMPAFIRLRQEVEWHGPPNFLAFVVHGYAFHHAIDLTRFLVGEPVRVTARYNQPRSDASGLSLMGEFLYVPDLAEVAIFEYPDGQHLVALTGSSATGLDRIFVNCHAVWPHCRLAVEDLWTSDVVGKLIRHPGGENLLSDVRVPDRRFQLSFDRSIAAFAQAVLEDRPPPTSGLDGLRVLEIERAVVLSQQEGRPVELSEITTVAEVSAQT